MQSHIIRQRAQELASRIRRGVPNLVPKGVAGQGDDFFEFEEYRQGASVNSIDWRASARRMTPVVRRREMLDRKRLYTLSPLGDSMNFSSASNIDKKSDIARILALALSIVSGENSVLSPPKNGIGRDDVLVVIDDFLRWPFDIPNIKTCFMIHVADRAELCLPYNSPHAFNWGGDVKKVDSPLVVRKQYASAIASHCKKLQKFAVSRGWGYGLCQTDLDLYAITKAAYQGLAIGG